MTAGNAYFAANPLNDRRYGNWRPGYGGYIRSSVNASRLEVPNQDIPLNGSPEWYEMFGNNGLEPPNQDIPLGDQTGGRRCGFINGSDSLFALADGTVLDFKTHRVVREPHQASGCWDDGRVRYIDGGYGETASSWNTDNQSIDDLIAGMDTDKPCRADDDIDPKSAAYWRKAAEEAAKLESSMTDEQKATIAEFESHFPMSRLVDESMKAN